MGSIAPNFQWKFRYRAAQHISCVRVSIYFRKDSAHPWNMANALVLTMDAWEAFQARFPDATVEKLTPSTNMIGE